MSHWEYEAMRGGGWELYEFRPNESDGHLAIFAEAEEEACRLAAAAPDLLAACEEAYQVLLRQYEAGQRLPPEVLNALGYAIRKARGG